MMRRVRRISLRNFRAYEAMDIRFDADAVVLIGPNGAGKTNLLEALSLMGPGRGLRRAVAADITRQGTGEGWGVGIDLGNADEEVTTLSLRATPPSPLRKQAQIDGSPAGSTGAFADLVRFQWLTPAQDRLFADGPGDRRRFLDRMALTRDAGHAHHSMAYEKAMRQRQAVLSQRWDTGLLDVLERQMAAHGTAILRTRADTVRSLAGGYAAMQSGAFPGARISLEGKYDEMVARGAAQNEVEAALTADLAQARRRDAEAGRALLGPHRSDLLVIHEGKDQPAKLCSTGEQKALLVGLVLAHTVAQAAASEVPLILLLDEISAHLDADRREALSDILASLPVQAFMTGTDAEPFLPWRGRAAFFEVREARLVRLEGAENEPSEKTAH